MVGIESIEEAKSLCIGLPLVPVTYKERWQEDGGLGENLQNILGPAHLQSPVHQPLVRASQ